MTQCSEYNLLADEYYNELLHPTCADFRDATILAQKKAPLSNAAQRIVEIGAGKSIFHSVDLFEISNAARELILLDSSSEMLSYSHVENLPCNSYKILANAYNLPLPSESQDLLISHLGDPYNTTAFWNEVSRSLKIGGQILFTTPSFTWATKFRDPSQINAAIFEVGHRTIHSHSNIVSFKIQKKMTPPNLKIIDYFEVKLSELVSYRSSKLNVLKPNEPIVSAYILERISND